MVPAKSTDAFTMQSALKLRRTDDDVFVAANQPWLPPGAQGIYGGTMIAQALVAGSSTVPNDFSPQSMYCTFLVGGAADPITYHVKRLADQSTMIWRTVLARQNGRVIFRTAIRFGKQDQRAGCENALCRSPVVRGGRPGSIMDGGGCPNSPYVCTKTSIKKKGANIAEAVATQWIKPRELHDADGDDRIYAASVAYLSDNYFLNTASRIHNIIDAKDPEEKLKDFSTESLRERAKMMVSLDHTIHFHSLAAGRQAGDWIYVEMQTPWAGTERALVTQRMYTPDGVLIATAIQEGLIRMEQPSLKL